MNEKYKVTPEVRTLLSTSFCLFLFLLIGNQVLKLECLVEQSVSDSKLVVDGLLAEASSSVSRVRQSDSQWSKEYRRLQRAVEEIRKDDLVGDFQSSTALHKVLIAQLKRGRELENTYLSTKLYRDQYLNALEDSIPKIDRVLAEFEELADEQKYANSSKLYTGMIAILRQQNARFRTRAALLPNAFEYLENEMDRVSEQNVALNHTSEALKLVAELGALGTNIEEVQRNLEKYDRSMEEVFNAIDLLDGKLKEIERRAEVASEEASLSGAPSHLDITQLWR